MFIRRKIDKFALTNNTIFIIMIINTKLILSAAVLVAGLCFAQPESNAQIHLNRPPLENYFTPSTAEAVAPLEDGFIQRWSLLEPIKKPNRGNTVFVDSYIREAFYTEYFKGQFDNALPNPKKKVKSTSTFIDVPNGRFWPDPNTPAPEPKEVTLKQDLKWHQLDSKNYNVKLYRFATNTNYELRYGAIFWAVTEIDCPEGLNNVRLSTGSNSASMWWIDGEEVVIMSGDRRMVQDDCASKRLDLAPGKHIIRVAVINGPGMSDFCVRFVDEKGNGVTNFTINNTPSKKK